MVSTRVHIINHTHWDREWFLTSVYTSRWIPRLIDKLERLVERNPEFRFTLDGQTLVIEDLLALDPSYEPRVRALVERGNLLVGPYYCQPDWQLTTGELLLRNLMIGLQDVAQLGQGLESGWLVDTFGHPAQSPQIHRLAAIDHVFVWRGVPALEPYFIWEGSDGSRLLAVDLFGGYRNLYGVGHLPEIAVARLRSEVERLAPLYPTRDIPLFDGYDLEEDPEDPLTLYDELGGAGADLTLLEATPVSFAAEIGGRDLSLPTIRGELNSGRYGATFPGTLSARTELKIMARDCERLLFDRCEPLAALATTLGRPYATARYERWTRELLQNAVHDCICGVSIDQVHEKMEASYRRLFEAMTRDLERSLGTILATLAPGRYAVGASPLKGESWIEVGDELVHARTGGVGLWPIETSVPIERPAPTATPIEWQNAHYTATLAADGALRLAEITAGAIEIYEERGDTYSDERGARLGSLVATGPPVVVRRSDHHQVARYEASWRDASREVRATVCVTFDASPLIRWQIDLDSRGTDLRVEWRLSEGPAGRIVAGMPFDRAPREPADTHLLPRALEPPLDTVLLGQREVGAVSTFPFHDYVILGDEQASLAVLARGLRAYEASGDGALALPLRRAVEWVTRSDLRDRVGDAGPFFYVPDARGEREVRFELAVAPLPPDAATLERLNAWYQSPPLIVRGSGAGKATELALLAEPLPMSSLTVQDGALLARLYNPTPVAVPLSREATATDLSGADNGRIDRLAPAQIATIRLPAQTASTLVAPVQVEIETPPRWRIGPNQSRPDPTVMDELEHRVDTLEQEIVELRARLGGAWSGERRALEHRVHVLERERLEAALSLLLNRRKLAEGWPPGDAYLYEVDEEIAMLGAALNRARIKRRVWDYIIQVEEM